MPLSGGIEHQIVGAADFAHAALAVVQARLARSELTGGTPASAVVSTPVEASNWKVARNGVIELSPLSSIIGM
jgi:hypothetical protein